MDEVISKSSMISNNPGFIPAHSYVNQTPPMRQIRENTARQRYYESCFDLNMNKYLYIHEILNTDARKESK
jgi:hypothetical protein